MKKTNITDTKGGIRTDSTCIVWTGPEIPCLDICAGDSLNDLVHALAEKICSSATSSDLSTLSLQCLVDKLNATIPTEKNILNILQVLIDNECKLKDLIDLVNSKITNPNLELNLNLGCLGSQDIYGNPLLLNQIQLDQILVNAICSLRIRVSNVEASIISLQQKNTELQSQINATIADPIITTCIGSPKPASQAIIQVAADYCNYKAKVGTLQQITFLIGQQGNGLATEFSASPGWVLNPTSEAQSLSNLWIAFNSYFNRLKVIEQTCCAPTCDKIKLGVIPTFDFQANTVTLLFSSGAGTRIPPGFTDVGTEITFIDKNGLKIGPYSTVLTPISINAEIPDLYLGVLAAGIITISFKTFFVLKDAQNNIILTCKDCMSIEVPYDSGCCVYTNSSIDPITIIYETTI
jgi:hypothetical protein